MPCYAATYDRQAAPQAPKPTIPAHLDWLVIHDGRIVSAHRYQWTAGKRAKRFPGQSAVVLVQPRRGITLRIGQQVRDDNGTATPL